MISFYHNQFLKTIALGSLFFLSSLQSFAQQATDYTVQANIVYRFTKYINWPEEKKTGDFVIGIVGDTRLYEELSDFVHNKFVGDQKIDVRKLSPGAQSYTCHILFISDGEQSCIKKINTTTADKPVLIVSESPGLARKGSCINFIIDDDRLKLEINKDNIESRNLSIASELLQLGIPVK
jgi:hypothetical protein